MTARPGGGKAYFSALDVSADIHGSPVGTSLPSPCPRGVTVHGSGRPRLVFDGRLARADAGSPGYSAPGSAGAPAPLAGPFGLPVGLRCGRAGGEAGGRRYRWRGPASRRTAREPGCLMRVLSRAVPPPIGIAYALGSPLPLPPARGVMPCGPRPLPPPPSPRSPPAPEKGPPSPRHSAHKHRPPRRAAPPRRPPALLGLRDTRPPLLSACMPISRCGLCTYLRWFARPTNNKTDLLRLPLPRKAVVSFLRFRTGCHALPNVIGTRTGVPRSQRLCPLCQSPYSDERYTLLECTALSPLRETYSQLFCPHVSMRPSCGRMICPSLRDMSLNACSLWQPHNPPANEVVKCRTMSGCCVATSLVACPGTSLPGN